MGKEKPGFLTPKAIANRIKSKGLQKLRWYCQMCQKQCRDENGFKCHVTSESHQRQLLLFGENPGRFMDDFSGSFKCDFLRILRRRFGTKRVLANTVYQEYISDKNHVHMSGTKWRTLTGFCQYLGREGICVVDETEKGWFIQYIDRDPETLRRQQELEKKQKLELADKERQDALIQKQIELAKLKAEELKSNYSELKKDENETIKLNFNKIKKEEIANNDEVKLETNFKGSNNQEKITEFDEIAVKSEPQEPDMNEVTTKTFSLKMKNAFKKPLPILPSSNMSTISSNVFSSTSNKRKLSALDQVMIENEQKKEKLNRKDYWLHENIIVKINTNKLGDKFFNKKGVIMSVQDKYVGIFKLLECDTIIKIDQAHVETVLPAIGKRILVVNGAYRGQEATLDGINENNNTAKVCIASGPFKGRIVDNMQYEDICKLNV